MYLPHQQRYDKMQYRRCGLSGLRLPAISLGLWHNFGGMDAFENMRAMLCRAFDLGITHFDLANNYGPPPGSAEENFGRALRADLGAWRDELIVSTKAGYLMGPGPYGDWGSRKYLLASLDQSLQRMGLDYVDIFYSHRPDPDTPVEETMSALDSAVRAGKALYAGISNYNPEQTARAVAILRQLGTPCLIHQMKYSMFVRTAEHGLFERLAAEGVGGIAFSPLAQGLLTDRCGRHTRRLARLEARRVSEEDGCYRGAPVASARAPRNRPATRTDAGPNGARVGATPRRDGERAGGRQPGGADRAMRAGAGQFSVRSG
jgi:L-glyceraldehyde 3-phosphate reductase